MAKTVPVASNDYPVAVPHAADHFLKRAMFDLRREKDAKSICCF